jgi:hypothetical protein
LPRFGEKGATWSISFAEPICKTIERAIGPGAQTERPALAAAGEDFAWWQNSPADLLRHKPQMMVGQKALSS